ncbi:hypothetical protein [Lactiplantibacillus mudanjiangensis]|uniref:Uncharacterized protein n=1 Tax=Lactiplantibacillus mudanjiangensis TaxID=1296538 RepID=A0A660E271_9LACO|nr:hypothetical protein [Lactiplantibacillus mudanjiangensis]VDG22551.1 hypothetical protein [Lactobacillus pentosus] [Lactiplantibacillus mudanjiangensis]VDG26914.1 hypothetical protein [Lactobacillus pentosus] [Lactiplantibacillus mudanjiangensis]
MAKDKLKLNEEKFAYAVVQNSNLAANEADDLKASKAVLKRYLTAYYMAQEFNTMEDRQFDTGMDFSLLASGIDAITLR